MTEDPITIAPDATVAEAARTDRAAQAQPAPGRRARPPDRGRHPDRRARRADRGVAPCRCGRGADRLRRDRAQLRPAGRARAPAALCAVVKADGYGHGAVDAARAAQRGGAAWLAVATAGEAAELRDAGLAGPLLVMGALSPEELDVAAGGAGRRRRLAARRSSPRCAGREVGVHVKLDTGHGAARHARPGRGRAGRGGRRRHARAAARGRDDPLRDRRRRPGVHGASSSRASARGRIVRRLRHAANSAAALGDPAARLDMVRCGIAIYGMDPFHRDPADHGLEPALELVSYVAEVKRARAGESVGYGRRFVAERDTWIATIPIGYGDGVRRGLTGRVDVLVGGRRVPIVGTVSMDNITVDLGDEPVERGTEVVLLGARGDERILAEDWARALGTINYEITCGLTRPRVPRSLRRRERGARRRARAALAGEDGVARRRGGARPAARPRHRRRRPRRARATRSAFARRIARAAGGRGVRAQRGVRRVAGGRAGARVARRPGHAARRRHPRRPRPARLHDQRDGRAARRRRAGRPARRAARTWSGGSCGW